MNAKEKTVGMFWGAVLVVIGVVFLLNGSTSLRINNPWLGMALTGGLSLAFFASYYFGGVQKWGWLFPASIFAGSTLVILFSQIFPAPQGGWIAAPVLLSVAAPFLVAYFQDPQKRAWALIPAYVLTVITLIAAFADFVMGELIGTFVLMMIALPFLVVYLRNRTRRWALIPFGVLAVIGLIPALTAAVNEALVGPFVLFLFAAPFFVVFITDMKRWWALIPGGMIGTMGFVALVSINNNFIETMEGGVLFLGIALTFLLVWLQRKSAPTTWAMYPAVGFAALALVTLLSGQAQMNIAWPILLIAGGLLLLYRTYRKKLV